MARDYGSRRAARHRKSAPQQFLVIIVSFLIGYLAATVCDVQSISQWMNTQVLASHEAKQTPSAKKSAELPPKPKFEFYTLLANEKTDAEIQSQANKAQNTATSSSASTATQVVASSAAPASAVKINPNDAKKPEVVKVAESKPLAPVHTNQAAFLVQVAAFKARADADHLKGALTLKGFDVNVVSVTLPKGTWFRVVVGPYSNRMLAQKAQVNLASTERLKGVITPVRG